MTALPTPLSLAELVLDYFHDREWTAGRRAAYQIGLCHGYRSHEVSLEIRRLAKRGRLHARKTVASRGVVEYSLPVPMPPPAVAAAVSPFQRVCDVLREHPGREWTLSELERRAHTSAPVVRACVERLADERVLERVGGYWRAADVPADSPGWWWAPGVRAPLPLRQRQRRRA